MFRAGFRGSWGPCPCCPWGVGPTRVPCLSILGAAGRWCCTCWSLLVAANPGGMRSVDRGMLCWLLGQLGHLCCPQRSRVLSAALAARGSSRSLAYNRTKQTLQGFGEVLAGWHRSRAGGSALGVPPCRPSGLGGVRAHRGCQSGRTARQPTARGRLLSRSTVSPALCAAFLLAPALSHCKHSRGFCVAPALCVLVSLQKSEKLLLPKRPPFSGGCG